MPGVLQNVRDDAKALFDAGLMDDIALRKIDSLSRYTGAETEAACDPRRRETRKADEESHIAADAALLLDPRLRGDDEEKCEEIGGHNTRL